MDRNFYSLEMNENNRLTKVFRFIMGILCIAIAVYWAIYNFRELRYDWSSWGASLFLTVFGVYILWTSFGYGVNFIEFDNSKIRLKNNSFLPVKEINSTDIDKITVFPLKFLIKLKSGKMVLTRFGITEIERNETIKDELLKYAERYNVEVEIKNET